MNVARRLPPLDHLRALSDDTGIVQHATYDVPNRSTGYCTDDVARAFMTALAATRFPELQGPATELARSYLAFLMDARLPDGRFHNFMSYRREWLDEVGTDDSIGRAMWALGFGTRFAPQARWRTLCARLLEGALPHVADLSFVRSRAYAGLGLAHARRAADGPSPALDAALRAIGSDLAARHAACAGPGWDWFENELTYDNARLPEALLRIGIALEETEFIARGKRTLDFYGEVAIADGTFIPIGNDGWYVRGGHRARYGQQPLEAAALVDAGQAALEATGEAGYEGVVRCAWEWFHGRNTRGLVLVDGGGCSDGLEERGANANMGAESTLAYLASAFAVASSLPATAPAAR